MATKSEIRELEKRVESIRDSYKETNVCERTFTKFGLYATVGCLAYLGARALGVLMYQISRRFFRELEILTCLF